LPWLCVNAYRNRSNGSGDFFHFLFASGLRGIFIRGNLGIDIVFEEVASLVDSLVRIGRFRIHTASADNIFVGRGRISSVASTVVFVAIDDLLRSQ